jgi:hypothetical protein
MLSKFKQNRREERYIGREREGEEGKKARGE